MPFSIQDLVRLDQANEFFFSRWTKEAFLAFVPFPPFPPSEP